MSVTHPYQNMKIEKAVRNAIEQAWTKHKKEFSILAISFEGQSDQTHESTAAVEIYKSNPQVPTVIRVPLRDLGTDTEKWPAILAQKGFAAAKQMRVREGIKATRKYQTLDDMA